MKKTRIFILLSVLLVTSLACGFSKPLTETTQEETTKEAPGGFFSDIGKTEVNSVPVSMNKGLSTLNTFKMTIEVEVIGPTQQDVTREKIVQEHSEPQDASIISIDSYSTTAEEPEPNTGITNIWRIGKESCTGSEYPEDTEFNSMEPDTKEMTDLVMDLFDMNFLIENPQFIGEESVNGVQTNHFTFQLSGLGVESGASVLANQGEYWLAVDGDYMVRYSLLVQTSSSPEKINHLKVYANLENINAPISLTMPQACYDAQNNEE
jgi:hypothetical protein